MNHDCEKITKAHLQIYTLNESSRSEEDKELKDTMLFLQMQPETDKASSIIFIEAWRILKDHPK